MCNIILKERPIQEIMSGLSGVSILFQAIQIIEGPAVTYKSFALAC